MPQPIHLDPTLGRQAHADLDLTVRAYIIDGRRAAHDSKLTQACRSRSFRARDTELLKKLHRLLYTAVVHTTADAKSDNLQPRAKTA